jgi:uncharacterized protein YndB with AHSA1/START domain
MLRLLAKLVRMVVVLVLAIAAALVGLYMLGSSLPQSHVATLSAAFPAAPDLVWKTITDVSAFPTWRLDIKSVEKVSAGPTGVSWVEVAANGDRIPLETVEAAPPKRLVARIGEGLPFGGTWTYELTPEGTGTRLTITERGEIYNPFYRFFARYVSGYTATMEGYFRALTTKLASP